MLIDKEELLSEIHRLEKDTSEREDLAQPTKDLLVEMFYYFEGMVLNEKEISEKQLKGNAFLNGILVSAVFWIVLNAISNMISG